MNHADTRPAALLALVTAVVTIAPHAAYVPLWVSLCCAALLAWQAVRAWRRHAPGGWAFRILILLLAAAIAGGVRLQFGYFFGKDPGIAMLAALLCLKLLEGRSARDLRVAVLLALFLQLGLFFNNQELPVAALTLLGVLLATGTMFLIEEPSAVPTRALRSSGVLMLQAIPFLLVLFVLFPRIPQLWGLPADAQSARTGLSEEMAPGSIGELSLSDEIALRAQFDGEPPPPSQRYWRGPVLTEFDGLTWRAARTQFAPELPYQPQGRRYDYVATLEAHDRRWLLALDLPGAVERPNTRFTTDLQLRSDTVLRERTRLQLSAYPETPYGLAEDSATLRQALRIPEESSPRTRAMVAQLIANTSSDQQTLDLVTSFLMQSRLTYTLSPPVLGDQPVDEFLFDTRLGFCEHFSSAFVFMMRAAGVPARVVTGYLGGTINSFDGSMVVRQSDAHAWAEVWLDGRGWVRVDPTALAAPSRVEGGLSSALPAGDPRPLLMRDGRAVEWLRNMRDRWDALSNSWNRNVLAFDQEFQLELMARLGLKNADTRTLALVVLGAVLMLMGTLLAWAMLRRPSGDALDRQWRVFCAKLAQRGVARLPSEGPIDYAERAAQALPASAAAARDIAQRYARLRYGACGPDTPARTRELTQRIREFSPQ